MNGTNHDQKALLYEKRLLKHYYNFIHKNNFSVYIFNEAEF